MPVELLFKAWAQPQHIKNWWGPDGFTNTFYEFDFNEGWQMAFYHAPGLMEKVMKMKVHLKLLKKTS